MADFISQTAFFGVSLTFITYAIGAFLKRKFHLHVLNALLISIALSMIFVALLKIPLENYEESTNSISFFLTPATVCLAVPLYEQWQKLKSNWHAILGGIVAGVLTNLTLVCALCAFFKLGHTEYASLLPKSITTAIGLALSNELGGSMPITMAAITVTGNLGNIFAEVICRVCGITDPVAKGVAIGTSSHVLGTAKAMEMGEIEGAMSSLSIAVAGLLTVIGASVFAQFL